MLRREWAFCLGSADSCLNFFVSRAVETLLTSRHRRRRGPRTPFIHVKVVRVVRATSVICIRCLRGVIGARETFRMQNLQIRRGTNEASIANQRRRRLTIAQVLRQVILINWVAVRRLRTSDLAPLRFFRREGAIRGLAIRVPQCVRENMAIIRRLRVVGRIRDLTLRSVKRINHQRSRRQRQGFIPLHATFRRRISLAP